MKKLMISFVTLAAVVGATVLPAQAAKWFNGGVAEGWPKAATLYGGAWTNTESSAFADGAVAYTNTSANALTFAATEARAPEDGEVTINTTVSLPERATLPAPRAKAGVVSYGGFFYVLAKDSAGDTNVWTKTDIVATDPATVKVVFTSATAATYTINGSTYNATIASVDSIQNVKLFGTGALSAMSAKDWMQELTATITPQEVAGTTFKIYTNDVPVDVASVVVAANTPAYVVYTVTNEDYAFADGSTTKTIDFDTSVDPAEAVGGIPAAPVQVWFDEAKTRFDTSYTTNEDGVATFVVTDPDQVLPIAYSTNNWGTATNAAGTVVGVTVSLLYQGPTYGPTTLVERATANGLYNWTLGASDYGAHNFGAKSVNSDLSSTNWLDGTIIYTTNFHLTVTAPAEGGTLAAYTNEVAAGNDSWPLGLVDEVKLVATPASELWWVEYVATNGDGRALAPASAAAVGGATALPVTNTFAMPLSDVAVTAQFRYVGVELESNAVAHASAKFYTNGVEVAATGDKSIVVTNTPAVVVYTAEDGYFFEGGKTVVTNDLDTTKNPATGVSPAAPMEPVAYRWPEYVDGIASNGIAAWHTSTVTNFTVVRSAASCVTWGTAGATSWYVVTGSDVAITGGVQCAGNVNLILCDGAKLTVTNVAENCAGIQTDAIGSFAIYGQPDGAGELSATGGTLGAGIGGGLGGDASGITINGGTVTAAGGNNGAGIGGGQIDTGTGLGGNGSNITINGGTVTATGGSQGAGIGGGYSGAGSNITINCGTVAASGGLYAAGIGGGCTFSGGVSSDIRINGGAVKAIGGSGGAGIGGGYSGAGQNISIVSGLVFVASAEIKVDSLTFANDLIGCGYDSATAASGNSVSADAKVFFNLTGIWDVLNSVWIESSATMPGAFEGFTIMTPGTQTVDRVLVGGCGALGGQGLAALPWVLTNAVTGAKGDITVNAEKHTDFANVFLHLTNDVNNLTLKVEVPAFTITQQPTVENLYTIAAETDGSEGITNYAWCAVASGVIVAQGETLTTFPPEKGEVGSNYICRVTYGHHGAFYTADSEAFVYGGVPRTLTLTQPAEGGALAAYTNGVSEATKVADVSQPYAGSDTVSIVATPTDWTWQVEWVKTNDVEFGRAASPLAAVGGLGQTALPVTNSFTMPLCDVAVTGSFVVSDAYRADASNTIGTVYLTTTNAVGALKRLTDEERQFFLDAAEDARTNGWQAVYDSAKRTPTIVGEARDGATNTMAVVESAAETMNDAKPWTIMVGSTMKEDGTNYFDKIDTAFEAMKFLPFATNIVVFGEQRATKAMRSMVFDWTLHVYNWNAEGQVDETKSPYQQSRLVFEESAQVDTLTNRLTKVDGEGRILFANDGNKPAADKTAEAFAQALRDVAGEPAEAKVQVIATAHDIALEGASYDYLDGEYVAIDSLTLNNGNTITNWVALSAPAVTNKTELTWDLTGDNQTTCLANYDDVVTNGATFIISLDDDQTIGSVVANYVIAGRAATADGATFKLVNGKDDVGDLVVGGGVQYYGTKAYTLDLVEASSGGTSNLVLDISWGMFQVTYDAMGPYFADHSVSNVIDTYVNTGYELPTPPSRTDYEFLGWYDSWTNGAVQVTDNAELLHYAPHTLYAKWLSKAVDPEDPSEKPVWEDTIKTNSYRGDGVIINGPQASESSESAPVPPNFIIPERMGDPTNGTPVYAIDQWAFYHDAYDAKVDDESKKIHSVSIPTYLNDVGQYAFYHCAALTNLNLSETRSYADGKATKLLIGAHAFDGSDLRTIVFPPNTVTDLGSGCFANCTNLTEIYFYGDVTSATKGPFRYSGNPSAPIKVHLSPTMAADAKLVQKLTNAMNSASIELNTEPLGTVEWTTPDITANPIEVHFSATIESPWGAINEKTVRLFYTTDLSKFDGIGHAISPKPGTFEKVGDEYKVQFVKPDPGQSDTMFFRLTIGAEK